MARILCVCPKCWDAYWQDGVSADFQGRCRKPTLRMIGLKALCDMADKVGGKHGVYYPILCSDCSARGCPPSLAKMVREATRAGEQKIGSKVEIRA